MDIFGYSDDALKCGHFVNKEKRKGSQFIWDLLGSSRMFHITEMETCENILGTINELPAT